MSTFPISIVIPVFNQSAFTQNCLDSLQSADEHPAQIVIVDNGSCDDTLIMLDRFARSSPILLRIETFDENRGFSAACNRGAEVATEETVVFLNNDTKVSKSWISPLISELRNPEVGLVGPKLVDPQTLRINHAGYVFNRNLENFYPMYQDMPSDFPGVNKRRSLQALLGACLAMRRDLFFSIGMFRSFGLEDIDLCLRVKKLGKEVIYQPSSVVFHYGSVTLKATAEDAMPPVSNSEFSAEWPLENLTSDDYGFYQEDGFPVERDARGVLTLESLRSILKSQLDQI